MVEFLKRLFIAKPHFTVAGVRFDTEKVLDGWFASLLNMSKGRVSYVKVDGSIPKFVFGFPLLSEIPEHHAKLRSRFDALLSRTSLSSPVQLGITHYHVCSAMGTRSDDVYIDAAALKILTPDEADGMLAHELAHIDLGHLGQIKTGKKGPVIKRDWEFAADARAAEITGNPKAVADGIAKVEMYGAEFRAASPFMAKLDAFSRATIRMGAVLRRKAVDGIHPSLSERVERLSTFAERLAREAVEGHIRIP